MTLLDLSNFFTYERSLKIKSTCKISAIRLRDISERTFVSMSCLAGKIRTPCWDNHGFVYVWNSPKSIMLTDLLIILTLI